MDPIPQFTQEQIASFQEQLKHPNDSKTVFTYSVLSTFVALGTISVALRLFARKYTRTKFGADDVMAVVAWVTMVGLLGMAMSCASLQRHIVFLQKEQLERALRTAYAGQYIYQSAICSYKAAILLYYKRIFPAAKPRLIINILLTTVGLHYLACLIVLPLECRPIAHTYKLFVPGKCIDIRAFFISTGVIGIILDLIIFVFPIPLIWRLKLALDKRISLIGVFMLGAIVVVSSIIRTYYIKYLVLNGDLTDPIYNNAEPGTWNLAEVAIGVICSCLPSIWPLFVKVKTTILSTTSRSRKTTNDQSGRSGRSIPLPALYANKFSVPSSTGSTTIPAQPKHLISSNVDHVSNTEDETLPDHNHQSDMSMHTRRPEADRLFV